MDGYTQPFDEGQKPKRLRKKDIEAILEKRQDGTDRLISIWYRPSHNEPLAQLVTGFSRSAAMVFSVVWKKQLESGSNVLVLKGSNMEPYKRILDWINICVDAGNDVKFPDIDENEHQLHVLLEVIATANFLKIPEMSLQAGLKKRAPTYARKHIIDLDLVERIYDKNDKEYPDDLQEIAAMSIFEAWWTKKLDEPEFDEYMSFLEQMRAEYPKLDEDLRDQFQKKKEFIEGKRDEKKRLRDAEASTALAGADEGWASASVEPAAVTVGGGWDSAQVDGAAEAGGNDWNNTGDGTSLEANTGNTWGGTSSAIW
ncbi:hypothetical protein VMCG_03820 [Cytospora schulzeri]|uniref:Uncharacterized protein n=1 Tax=Cytospora schulzeri TaxID=448051 RepID=A0A423WVE9_9PEZI|nr:hypothetical protein VMCG_03820 [Valsa malicola]